MTFRQVLVPIAAVVMLTGTVFAHEEIFTTVLLGSNEEPPNASPGTGTATVTIDFDLATIRVQTEFSGLISPTTVAHIHCCTTNPMSGVVGVATQTPTFPGFPAGVTAGIYDATFSLFDAATYNPAFMNNNGGTPASAMVALINGLQQRRAYLNIHTSQFPAGEIRGFLVPEPAAGTLLALLSLGGLVRRRIRN